MGIIDSIGKLSETLGKVNSDIYVLAASALILAADYLLDMPLDIGWFTVALCGIPIIMNAFYALISKFDIKADLLVSIAIIASVLINDVFAAGTIALIMSFGAFLEQFTVNKTRKGLESLNRVRPEEAEVRQNEGHFLTVPVSSVRVGDVVRVLAGGTVPVDGTIIEGDASIDESVLTGESVLSEKTVGNRVLGGSVSRFGSFLMRADAVGEDTSIQRMIRLVDSADPGRARIVRAADRWATWIVTAALIVSAAVFLMTGDMIRSVTVLVVFCPCSYVLATPTAIMAAIGNLSKKGVMVRRGDALERMAEVSVIAFDKTGTITEGILSVTEVVTLGNRYSSYDILSYASAAESMSEHPIGRCIARSGPKVPHDVTEQRMIPGKGITAVIDGKTVIAGNAALMKDHVIELRDDTKISELQDTGHIAVYVAIEGDIAGAIIMSDTVREGSKEAIAQLRRLGAEAIIITGDSEGAGNRIASEVNASGCYSRCLPEDKLYIVKVEEDKGRHVCMIGDGVNDVAALHASSVGIAMGMGRDSAIEAADMVLVEGGLGALPHIYGLSKRTERTIHFNLAFATGINIAALALAVFGLIDPVIGSLIHNIGSVFVITMSSLLLRWKLRRSDILKIGPQGGDPCPAELKASTCIR